MKLDESAMIRFVASFGICHGHTDIVWDKMVAAFYG